MPSGAGETRPGRAEDPAAGGPLGEISEPVGRERARIERILARLDEAEDLVERADLGSELVRSASRYEDAVERAVLSGPPDHDAPGHDAPGDGAPGSGVPRGAPDGALEVQEGLARRRESLREAMTVVHERTMHVDPRNVHAADPQGFEDALDEVRQRLRTVLAEEDAALAPLVGRASGSLRQELAGRLTGALRHASERPRPPRTALGRVVANAHVKLDHTLEDVATPRHPGAGTIDGDG